MCQCSRKIKCKKKNQKWKIYKNKIHQKDNFSYNDSRKSFMYLIFKSAGNLHLNNLIMTFSYNSIIEQKKKKSTRRLEVNISP